jgi:hypothetical protein
MELIATKDQFMELRLSLSELIAINNALNEVCNGLPTKDFENRIGASLKDVEQLLKTTGQIVDSHRHH